MEVDTTSGSGDRSSRSHQQSPVVPTVILWSSRVFEAVFEAFPVEFRRRRQVEKDDDFRDDPGGLYLTPISRAVLKISIVVPWSSRPILKRFRPSFVDVIKSRKMTIFATIVVVVI